MAQARAIARSAGGEIDLTKEVSERERQGRRARDDPRRGLSGVWQPRALGLRARLDRARSAMRPAAGVAAESTLGSAGARTLGPGATPKLPSAIRHAKSAFTSSR